MVSVISILSGSIIASTGGNATPNPLEEVVVAMVGPDVVLVGVRREGPFTNRGMDHSLIHKLTTLHPEFGKMCQFHMFLTITLFVVMPSAKTTCPHIFGLDFFYPDNVRCHLVQE
jgi:hypothetical protein